MANENSQRPDEDQRREAAEDDAPQLPRPKICSNCMTENEEYSHLCRQCLAPLSSHAAIDPVLSIAARADTFGKAANAPRKPIVLLGMWMIFGPVGFMFLGGFATIIWSLVTDPTFGAFMALLPVSLFLYISGALLYKTTANYFRGAATEVPEAETAPATEADRRAKPGV